MMHNQITLLLIEDNPMDADLIHEYLLEVEDVVFSIEHATRLQDALVYLEEQAFDITLLDLSLPDSQGIDSFHRIQGTFPNLPIVILTGHDDAAAAAIAVRSGAQDYLFKQYLDSHWLLSAIRHALERKQAQEQILELTLERERTQLLARFVRDVTHEFRTPLAVIVTSLDLMLRVEGEVEKDIYRTQVTNQVDKISQLIDMMMVMAKLDTNPQFEFEPINIHNLVDYCRVATYSDWYAKQQTLIVEEINPSLAIKADREKFYLALRLILENAIRYTPEAGTITLRAKEKAKQAIIQIQDTGVGISDKILPHIFERFYREDNARTTNGLGLGLPIAEAIIRHHQGNIHIESQVGTGTTVTIMLPTVKAVPH